MTQKINNSRVYKALQKFLKEVDIRDSVQVNGVSQPVTFTLAIAAGAANTLGLTVTAKDAKGTTVAQAVPFELHLSDAATGIGLTTAAPSGALTVTGGAEHTVLTAKKHITGSTAATGIATFTLVDTAKTAGIYFCVKTPFGLYAISAATVTGSYGA